MRKRIIIKLTLILSSIGILLAAIQSYNFKDFGVNIALDKANSIAQIVQNGLTSHMVNDTMDKRDIFIKSIADIENVKQLWIVRGENVSKQYGEAEVYESPRDHIDLDVLKSSQLKYKLDAAFQNSTIRVTIPFNAVENKQANCLNCHQVNYGDTLGAISLVLDLSNIQSEGLKIQGTIILFTVFAVVIVLFLITTILKPHLETIEGLSGKIKDISNGIFTNIPQDTAITAESQSLIKEYNTLVNGLNRTFNDIDKKLNIFVGNQVHQDQNPLLNSQKIISSLSDIYQFKKEIEIDSSKQEIYERLAQILKNKFDLEHFMFMEQNYEHNTNTIVYKCEESDFCSKYLTDEPELCRVVRSTNDVISSKNHKVCNQFSNDEKMYYCTFIDIGDQTKLVINFVLNTKEKLHELKGNIPLIRNYFLEAAPSLIVKHLLDELKASAFRDGLTGLYNRKFLDEHIEKLIPHALRENINIGVLMLDMDHFKAVNDEYGHDIGDLVLKELGRILSENVRDSDIVVRYGGEEFVVLLVGVSGDEAALEVANKIRTKVSENEINVYAGNKLKKTISVGLSMFPEDSRNFEVVMKNADIALYDAKETGRNQAIRWKERVDVELF